MKSAVSNVRTASAGDVLAHLHQHIHVTVVVPSLKVKPSKVVFDIVPAVVAPDNEYEIVVDVQLSIADKKSQLCPEWV